MRHLVKDAFLKKNDGGLENVIDSGAQRIDQSGHDYNMPDWQQAIESNVKIWMEEISSLHEPLQMDTDDPDLYSFYEELCALRNEFRKSARRSHDTFSRFSETLAGFEQFLKGVSAKILEKEDEKEKSDLLSKKGFFLPLVEILERFRRIEHKVEAPPKTNFFSAGRTWGEAWSSLGQGVAILRSHFEELLKKEGVTAIETAGKSFNPSLMTVVDTEETNNVQPNMVLETFSGGYLYHGHVLKPAEVKISKGRGV